MMNSDQHCVPPDIRRVIRFYPQLKVQTIGESEFVLRWIGQKCMVLLHRVDNQSPTCLEEECRVTIFDSPAMETGIEVTFLSSHVALSFMERARQCCLAPHPHQGI
jgi:hypothetical protein